MNTTHKKSQKHTESSVRVEKVSEGQVDVVPLEEEHSGAASLDKVRDILFGAQSREYEKRFTRLEERLLKEAADLRNDLRSHFDSLEVYVKKEVESLTGRMKNEHQEKSESLKLLGEELSNLSRQIQARISELDDQASQGHRDLRDQVLNQQKTLSQEIQEKNSDLAAMVEKALEELRGEKLDRASLADLFMESAVRLNNAFKLPTKE